MEESLMAHLLASTDLTAIVGQRIRYGRASQTDARPFVVLQVVSGSETYTMAGPSGYRVSRLQVDCYAESYATAKRAVRAVRAALSDFREGGIQGVFIDSERDLPAADAGNVSTLFRSSIDINVHHGESS
ncbi:hypothetical protein BJF92_11310 [Rhizobium rhizosphaerae]|uniref:DUF3168 domain-containing protein n=1 Tax=Xaviernesmea rhizosphaerae TaxID=1672749 RepID=A0A1Q9AMX5_9HYPH|nr:DUF3168 domain-containing protein [Xaviernesmea rhizosphaerae]OLP56669.1 hypothetical protein BJF92_11310 [Xaviernesmea rhizosphaerae]